MYDTTMYVAGESPNAAVTSSVTAAMSSPKVVLMVSRGLVIVDALSMCCRLPLNFEGKRTAKVMIDKRVRLI